MSRRPRKNIYNGMYLYRVSKKENLQKFGLKLMKFGLFKRIKKEKITTIMTKLLF